eukprot:g5570.t1
MKTDPRFAKAKTDPRFRAVTNRKKQSIPEDVRFKEALNDPIFQDTAPVDKYGRPPIPSTELLNLDPHQLRRMVGLDGTSSDSESLQSDANSTEDYDWGIGKWAANPDELIPTIESTHRLAVVDMDWSKISAVELLAAFRSFTPVHESVSVKRVTVYLSEYGSQRLPKEDTGGPSALGLFTEGDEDEEVDNEKIRKYEKSKLRYYYAVVDCSSVKVAEKLMEELDGSEFEASHCCLDLRFIPNEMTFDNQVIKDQAESVPNDFQGVQFECDVLQKTNVQLTWDQDDEKRMKVVRRRFTEDELQDQDFKAYLGSESEEDEEIQTKYKALLDGLEGDFTARKGSKTWDLEKSSEDEDLSESSSDSNGCLNSISIQGSKKVQKDGRKIWNEYQKSRSEKLLKQKRRGQFRVDSSESDSDPREVTTTNPVTESFFETNEIDSRLEKTGTADLELRMMDDQALRDARGGKKLESSTAMNFKRRLSRKERMRQGITKKKLKKQSQEDPDFKVNIEDPRFSKALNNADFALDPTDPAYRRTVGAESLLLKIKSQQKNKHSSTLDGSLN